MSMFLLDHMNGSWVRRADRVYSNAVHPGVVASEPCPENYEASKPRGSFSILRALRTCCACPTSKPCWEPTWGLWPSTWPSCGTDSSPTAWRRRVSSGDPHSTGLLAPDLLGSLTVRPQLPGRLEPAVLRGITRSRGVAFGWDKQ